MNVIVFSAFWGILMMFAGLFLKRSAAKYVAIAGMVLLFIFNAAELNSGWLLFTIESKGLIRTSGLSLAFLAVLSLVTLLYFLLSGKEMEKVGSPVSEYFALIFFSFCGIGLCCTFNSLLMLFLGVEIMSIPLYVLTGSEKKNIKSNEAALKYFLLGSFSTGILLLSIAFMYGANPHASFSISDISIAQSTLPVLMAAGMVLLLAAMSFKVSAAPFHFWTPDVYDGSPTVFTSYMSTVVKAAAFFAFIRVFENIFGLHQSEWQGLIAAITLATLFFGNITAVFQVSVKRMLAYSSIAQAGFMMLSLFALNDHSKEGLVLYAAAYSFATIGLFAIMMKMDDYTIEGFNGLSSRHPLLAFAALIFLLSLTGIPLTAGFQAKFWVVAAATENGKSFWIVPAALLFAAVGAYYYFRVIQAMYFKPAAAEGSAPFDVSFSFRLLLILTILLILVLGVYPEILIGWIYHI